MPNNLVITDLNSKICVMSNVSSHMLIYNGSSSSNSQNMHRSKSSLQPMSFFLNQSQISHIPFMPSFIICPKV